MAFRLRIYEENPKLPNFWGTFFIPRWHEAAVRKWRAPS